MSGSIPASPSAEAAGPAAAPAPRPTAPLSPGREAWRRFRKHRLAVVSLFVLGVMVFAIVFGPYIWRVPIGAIDFGATLPARPWRIRWAPTIWAATCWRG